MSERLSLYHRRVDLIEALAHRRTESDPTPLLSADEREALKAMARFGGEYAQWASLELQRDAMERHDTEVLGSNA